MKILKSVQNSFAILGINLNQSTLHRSFNFKKLIVIFVFGTSVILSYVSIFLAQNFKEYTDSIHMAMALTLGSSMFAIVLCKKTKMSELIDTLKRIIADSEYRFFNTVDSRKS